MLASGYKISGEDAVDHIKRVTDEFGRQAQTFDVWAEKTDDQVADRFRTALGKAGQGNVLDVACGPGVVTAAIAPGAASVVAFDATEQMLEKARARCAKAGLRNVQFKRGDAESLPFIRALAEAGRTAGMGLSVKNGQVVFFHRWRLLKATKPLGR
jgi:ubiquinone/menaquinone biosynthesis C-methylase UbiE